MFFFFFFFVCRWGGKVLKKHALNNNPPQKNLSLNSRAAYRAINEGSKNISMRSRTKSGHLKLNTFKLEGETAANFCVTTWHKWKAMSCSCCCGSACANLYNAMREHEFMLLKQYQSCTWLKPIPCCSSNMVTSTCFFLAAAVNPDNNFFIFYSGAMS